MVTKIKIAFYARDVEPATEHHDVLDWQQMIIQVGDMVLTPDQEAKIVAMGDPDGKLRDAYLASHRLAVFEAAGTQLTRYLAKKYAPKLSEQTA